MSLFVNLLKPTGCVALELIGSDRAFLCKDKNVETAKRALTQYHRLKQAHKDGRLGTLRPDVGRRAHTNGERAAERAGVRQEECGGIHRVGKRGLSVCGCSHSKNLPLI
jgi:hypothetical protein